MTKFLVASKLKLKILSEKMATPLKPTKAGKGTRALPDFTALTGNRPDGTLVPTKLRPTPQGIVGESPNNQNIKSTQKRGAEEMDTSHSTVSSLNDMNDTIGWSEKDEDWATQMEKVKEKEEASILDEVDSDENSKEKELRNKGKGKNKTRRTGEPQDKRIKISWSDAARNHICLITSEKLDLDLVHEDFTHIQSQVLRRILALPIGESDELMMPKSGMRNGGIQLALETLKGVAWYREIVPQLEPRETGGPRYRFFGPGQRPFYVYKAYSAEVDVSKNKDDVKNILIRCNKTFRTGFLAVSVMNVTKTSVALRIKVSEDRVAPLTAAANIVYYGMGTLTLIPLFGDAGRDAEDAMEVEGTHQ